MRPHFGRLAIIFVMLLLSSCGSTELTESEAAKLTVTRSAELDLFVQNTLQAQLDRERSIQQTLLANTPVAINQTPVPILDMAAAASSTNDAPASTTMPANPAATATTTGSSEPFDEKAFAEWMRSAKIVVYEDMTARLETFRYVFTTLNDMGLDFKDDGSAIGWFIDDLESGPEEGGQWDLIIIAIEDKKGIKANFFDQALEAAEQGSSVILEVWNLNNTYNSSASSFLSQCGLVFEKDWAGIPPSSALLFPIERNHPILNQPNSNLAFSSPTNQWWDPSGQVVYDVGDLIGLSTLGDAKLLLGTGAGGDTVRGTAAVCSDERIIVQTFSSHLLSYESMSALWENYIYHALRVRFETLNS